jgi:hypothetical protein
VALVARRISKSSEPFARLSASSKFFDWAEVKPIIVTKQGAGENERCSLDRSIGQASTAHLNTNLKISKKPIKEIIPHRQPSLR